MSSTIIDLDTPIPRKKAITRITLRKPRAGELRGVSLAALVQMDVIALQRVLPRITDPVLTDAEIQAMDPADLLHCGAAVSTFLIPQGLKTQASLSE